MKENIGPFKLYKETPNDIQYGCLYTMEVELPILYSKKRMVRVYLPEDFTTHKLVPYEMPQKYFEINIKSQIIE